MRSISYQDIKEAIAQVLLPGHNLAMVHSSIGMFGLMENLEQIEQNYIKAWIEAADCAGYTIAMPTFTWSFCKTGMYHFEETLAETGVLPESFRKQDKVIRGNHPIFSFAGYGPRAKEFVSHQGETCWGKNTPFDYLYKQDGLLIMFGIGWEYLTFYHYLEEIKSVPYHYFKTFRGKADYGNGWQEVITKYHVRSLHLPSGSDFRLIHDTLDREGKMKTVKLGDGFIKVLRVRDIYDLGVKLIDKDLYVFLMDKEAYLKEIKKPLFAFLGSSNLDIMTDEFEKRYEETTKNKCRTMKMAFAQYRQEILNPDSDIRLEPPNYIIFCERAEDIFGDLLVPLQDREINQREFNNRLQGYIEFIKQARRLLSAVFLVMDFLPLDTVNTFHSSECKKLIDSANNILSKELNLLSDTYILSYARVVTVVGSQNATPGKYWFIGRVPFSAKLTACLCDYVLGAFLFLEGKTIRLIITDLDNTMWGGIIGEDGISGIQLGPDYPGNCYVTYQKLLKEWQKQGKILAVVSKNTEAIALEAIEKHPDMVLKKEDFVSLKIDWNNKVDNIKAVCNELNLGLSSVCFIDDSPFERQQVKERLPEVFVPEMPRDIAEWTNFLSGLPKFEVLSLTEDDLGKSERYQKRKAVEQVKKQFSSVLDFYRNLEMKLFFLEFSATNENRVLQLLAKTNQFNTTTRRYKKNDLEALLAEKAVIVPIGVADRLSAFEIIGLIILRFPVDTKDETIIDVFLLSCRVLGRDLERGILSWVTHFAQKKGVKVVKAQIIPTEKNIPVRGVYSKYGFTVSENNIFIYALKNGVISMPDYFRINDEMDLAEVYAEKVK